MDILEQSHLSESEQFFADSRSRQSERAFPLVFDDLPETRIETNQEHPRDLRPLLVVASIGLILSASIAIFARQSVDYPVVSALNGFVGHSQLFDRTIVALTKFNLLKGVVLLAMVWLVWFDAPRPEARARIAAGLLAAALAGLVSRGLQLVLPTHLRPIHEQLLSLVLPQGAAPPESIFFLNSFPSDHASLLFGIATVVAIMRPRLGIAAFAWALVITLSRIVAGYHFMSDVLGGAALAVVIVCASQLPIIIRACLVFPRWATERAGVFYAGAFIAAFSIATMFDDIRAIGKELVTLVH